MVVRQCEVVGGDEILAGGAPQGTELGPLVVALVIRVLMAWRHLLHRVDVHVNVRGGVRCVQHLPVGQDEAACGILPSR